MYPALRRPLRPPADLAALAVPLAAFAAMASWARFAPDGAGETAYLATLATGVLLAVAALAPRPALETGLGAGLVVLAVWAIPPVPLRGATVSLVLIATLAAAAFRRLRGDLGAAAGDPRPATPTLSWASALPLALGLQLLLRSDRLLAPTLALRPLVGLLGLPLLAAAAAVVLARRVGAARALVAAGAILVAGAGWHTVGTLALVALAAGAVLGGNPVRRARPARIAAAAVLLVPLLWEPRSGLVALAAGLAVASRRRRWTPLAVAVAALAATLGGGLLGPLHPWPEAAALAAWLPLLLPGLVAVAVRPERLPALAAAFLLALAGGRLAPSGGGPAALAAAVGLAALLLPADEAGSAERSFPRAALAVQGVWSAALLAATVLLATYPWLRAAPARDALALVGLQADWRDALLVLALAALAALTALAPLTGALAGARRIAPGRHHPRSAAFRTSATAAGLAVLVLAAGLLSALPSPGSRELVGATPVLLDATAPAWESTVPAGRFHRLVIDSDLAHAADLAPGTPVATVVVKQREGPAVRFALRAGIDTGEWAASRPDVARRPGFAAPAPWLSWVAVEGGFFGRRFRASRSLDGGEGPAVVRIERRPELPGTLTLALHRVEVQP